VSYDLPFMKNAGVVLEGSIGFCQDALDSRWEIVPELKINIAEFFFEVRILWRQFNSEARKDARKKPR
jgi:hypothetical protein